jgi:hypothetical protein
MARKPKYVFELKAKNWHYACSWGVKILRYCGIIDDAEESRLVALVDKDLGHLRPVEPIAGDASAER